MHESLTINDRITIPGEFLDWKAVCSPGPGGQNVNKVATSVELRFDIRNCAVLSAEVKERFKRLPGLRFDEDGRVIIVSRESRSQSMNLEDALERLRAAILTALPPPKIRRPTKPSRSAKERRLTTKRKHSLRKESRRQGHDD